MSTEMRPPITLHRALLVVISAIVAVALGLIVVTLNRGFDWNDEGFVLALTASARSAPGEVWGFQLLMHPLYELVGESALVLRVIRLLVYVALGLLLTCVAARVLRGLGVKLRRSSWALVALVGQAGTLAAFSYPPRYVGYNEVSGWLTQVGVALLVLLLLSPEPLRPARSRARWLLWGAVGALLVVLFVAKFSSAIMVGVVTLVAMVAFWRKAQGTRLTMLGVPAGAAVAALVLLVSGVPLLEYTQNLLTIVLEPSAARTNGHSPAGLLHTYLLSARNTLSNVAVPLLLAGAALFVVAAGMRRPGVVPSIEESPLRRIAPIAATLAAAQLVLNAMFTAGGDETWMQIGVTLVFVIGLAGLGLAVLAPTSPSPDAPPTTDRLKLVVAISLLALAPLLSSAGTENQIFGQGLFSASLWCVCAGLALAMLWERVAPSSLSARLAVAVLLATSVAVPAVLVATDVFLHPYRTAPYLTQRSQVTEGPLRGISVTSEEADAAQWLMDQVQTLDAVGVPTVSIATPGALLLFNSSDWASTWPSQDWVASMGQTCEVDPPTDLFVIQSAEYEEDDDRYVWAVGGLAACGFDFPEDFEVVEHHSSAEPKHDLTIWRLR